MFKSRKRIVSYTCLSHLWLYYFCNNMNKKLILVFVLLAIVLLGSGFLAGIYYEKIDKSIDEKIIDCLKLGSDERAAACVRLVTRVEKEKMNPLVPSKDVFQVGEDINYSYLTLKIESVKKISDNQIEVDLYVYNSNKNPNKLLIFNSQFHLEALDKTRIEPNYDDGRLRGVDVNPDEAIRGRVIFQNDALKVNKSFLLKVQPFEGSPALTIDISKYL